MWHNEERRACKMICLSKKYRYRGDGYKLLRILCVDAPGDFPVVSMEVNGTINRHTENGNYCTPGSTHSLDLIEVSPYEDFKKDDPVMVRVKSETWVKRHFSHVDENGKPNVYDVGRTSWTAETTVPWGEMRRPTEEELKS